MKLLESFVSYLGQPVEEDMKKEFAKALDIVGASEFPSDLSLQKLFDELLSEKDAHRFPVKSGFFLSAFLMKYFLKVNRLNRLRYAM